MTRKFKEPTVTGLVIILWIIDKIFMLIMFIFVFEVGRIGSAIHDFIVNLF